MFKGPKVRKHATRRAVLWKASAFVRYAPPSFFFFSKQDFATADALRSQLRASGVELDDKEKSWRATSGLHGATQDTHSRATAAAAAAAPVAVPAAAAAAQAAAAAAAAVNARLGLPAPPPPGPWAGQGAGPQGAPQLHSGLGGVLGHLGQGLGQLGMQANHPHSPPDAGWQGQGYM